VKGELNIVGKSAITDGAWRWRSPDGRAAGA